MRHALIPLALLLAAAPVAAQDSPPEPQPRPPVSGPLHTHLVGGWEGWLWRRMPELAPASKLRGTLVRSGDARTTLISSVRSLGADGHPLVRAELWLALGACRGGSRRFFEGIVTDGARPAAERESACVALGLLGDAAALPLLERLANDRRGATGLRAAACLAAGLLRDPSALPGVLRVLSRPDDREVQQAAVLAARALAEAGEGSARKALYGVARSYRAGGAIRALALPGAVEPAAEVGELGTRIAGLPRLLVLAGRDVRMRRAAVLVRTPWATSPKEWLTRLDWLERAARTDGDPLVRGWALCELAAMAKTGELGEHQRLVGWFHALAQREADELVRPFAVLALGVASSERLPTGPVLASLLQRSGTPADRCAAAVALGLSGYVPGRDFLAKLVMRRVSTHERGYAAIGLALLPYEDDTERFLAEVAGNVNVPEVKSAALRALGLMGPSEAGRAAIRRAFTERNRYTKMAALTAVVDAGGIGAGRELVSRVKREGNWEMRVLAVRALSAEAGPEGAERLRALFTRANWTVWHSGAPTLRYLARY